MARAEAIVLATARHVVPKAATTAEQLDCALFLDMDLAILGADPAAFDAYDAAIRTEFSMFPDEVYRPGRKGVLEGLLNRDRIYLTDEFHESHDARARENLSRAVRSLSALG